MSCGETCSENALQTGHWGSPNSTIVVFAPGSPRTLPRWGMPLSCLEISPTSLTSVLLPPLEPPPDWLITIATTTTMTAARTPPTPSWTIRRRRPAAASAASRRRLSSRACSRCSLRLATRPPSAGRCGARVVRPTELGAGIAKRPRRIDREQRRHQDGAGDAPLTDRIDHEQLQVGEVGGEPEAYEGR